MNNKQGFFNDIKGMRLGEGRYMGRVGAEEEEQQSRCPPPH
jgi:hypothetical protein